MSYSFCYGPGMAGKEERQRNLFLVVSVCEREFFGGKGFRLYGEYYDWQGLELLLLSLSHRPYRQYPFG